MGKNVSALQIAKGYDNHLQETILGLQEDVDLGKTLTAPRLAIAEKNFTRPVLIKVVCAIIKMLDYSLNLTFELTAIQVFECAQLFMDKYRTESVQDLVLCLRMLKQGDLYNAKGEQIVIYNRIDAATMGEWMTSYLTWKADRREEWERQAKSDNIKTQTSILNAIAEQMPPDLKATVAHTSERFDIGKVLVNSAVRSDTQFSAYLAQFVGDAPDHELRQLLRSAIEKRDEQAQHTIENELKRRGTERATQHDQPEWQEWPQT
jgi:hypothetical protein